MTVAGSRVATPWTLVSIAGGSSIGDFSQRQNRESSICLAGVAVAHHRFGEDPRVGRLTRAGDTRLRGRAYVSSSGWPLPFPTTVWATLIRGSRWRPSATGARGVPDDAYQLFSTTEATLRPPAFGASYPSSSMYRRLASMVHQIARW